MDIPDFVQFSCPNCACTIQLESGNHPASQELKCDLCGQIMSIPATTWNWLHNGGFFRKEDQGDGEAPMHIVPPMKFLEAALRSAQEAIRKKRNE